MPEPAVRRRRHGPLSGVLLCAALLGLFGCTPTPAPAPLLVPGFAAAVDGLTRIEMAQGNVVLNFERRGPRWWVADAEWPVATDWLNPLLVGLLSARCDEPRTADPAQYPRIGVGWPPPADDHAGGHHEAAAEAFGQQSGRLTLDGNDGRHVLVIGHAHPRGGTFVRREGEPESCYTRADLRLPLRTSQWFEPRLLDAAEARVVAVEVGDPNHPPLTIERVDDGWRLAGQGMALSPVAAALGTAAANLRQIDRVAAPATFEPQRTLVLTLVDGQQLTVALRREGAVTFAQVQDGADSPRYRGRQFRLPEDVAAPLWGSRAGLGASADRAD